MLIIIPTKNRFGSLVLTLNSIFLQSRLPKQVLIVDQSNDSAEKKIKTLFKGKNVIISYIYMFPETGLVRAKRKAVDSSFGDPVCVLEDDVVLDPNFLEEILGTFAKRPNAMGVGGICQNSLNNCFLYVILHWVFYRGLFRDSRPLITWKASKERHGLYSSETVSGGISAWRRNAFERVQFEPKDGFHMFEDVHFCRKLAKQSGFNLWINTRASLLHFPASEGRAPTGEFEAQRMQEAFALYRYHRQGFFDLLALLWLSLGLTIFSALKSLRHASFLPMAGHWKGLQECLIQKK
jgi:GT2 family glycosyltransferase